jgi:electron transfer flavoprotein alpha/beta subunit
MTSAKADFSKGDSSTVNIVVCIKQVPDAPSIRMDKERMTIIRDGVESIINPLDAVALDAALVLKDKQGARVIVLTMGPPQSEEALREALAAGADQAVLITDPRFAGADTLATSHTLARAISRLEPFPDLILCGKQSIDSDTGHVGPQIAEELDLPQACGVTEIHLEENSLMVRQVSDGFLNTLRVDLPALLTVSHELSVPRYLPFGEIERAFTGCGIIRWGLADLHLEEGEVGFEGSATKVLRLYRPPPKRRGEVLSGSSQEVVESLINKLESLSIIDEEEAGE